MEKQSVTHHTYVIERPYPVKPERVFAAFADPAQKNRWFADGAGFEGHEYQLDFRVGGFERKRFPLKKGVSKTEGTLTNETFYQDIVTNRRIVIAYTMAIGDYRMSASQATFEFLATEEGTLLIFTEQGAYFANSDGPKIREGGWRELLERLGKELER